MNYYFRFSAFAESDTLSTFNHSELHKLKVNDQHLLTLTKGYSQG